MSDQKNFLLAIVLSLAVLLVWQEFFVTPQLDAERARQEQEAILQDSDTPTFETDNPVAETLTSDAPTSDAPARDAGADGLTAAVSDGARLAVTIDTPALEGSVSLRGGRIDDLILKRYFDEVGDDAENIKLLTPASTENGYFAEFGWIGQRSDGLTLPGSNTVWQATSGALTPDSPLHLTYDNGAGLIFSRTISVDDQFMFTVSDRIENTTDTPISVQPYAMIVRQGMPDVRDFFVLHEGPIGVFDGTLVDHDLDYGDLVDEGRITYTSTGGWAGIADKYWMAALIPDQEEQMSAHYRHATRDGQDRFLVDYVLAGRTITAGGSLEVDHRLFAGAKEIELINEYAENPGIVGFERAIDWGWYPFLTKPIFAGLDFFYGLTGNFGVAILLLTVLIKLALFPLANKSYVAMSKMKKLQPKMKELQERFKDDKARQQQELMALYKKEKANPLAGCLPIVVQIPVFFALYKTLFISIEMRHQPFFGWVHDLSAPDPATIITLFGLAPWDAPGFLMIGVWPLIMGFTMFLQQKLNPQSPDPVQAKLMMFMPVLFMFILAPFPVGLVIYWSWNNTLSILQQWTIMRRMGVSVSDG